MSGAVLVGDVGGTRSRFALARRGENGWIALEHFKALRNDDFSRFDEALSSYLAGIDAAPRRALFALAGPVREDGGINLTNRDWPTVRPNELETRCGLAEVRLVNDFAAMSRAIPELQPVDFITVREGEPDPAAPVIVTGPGTGFGVGTLVPLAGGGYHVLTGEGGHSAYAAHTVREAELAERMSAAHGYVSTEMIVSGAWLQPVFDHLSDMHGVARQTLAPAEIQARAEAGDPVCDEVCRLRARAIMGAVGDLVLINGGRGGAVLTGGVAERMTRWLSAPEALERFRERGSHSTYMDSVPVSVLTRADAPLIGAASLLFDLET